MSADTVSLPSTLVRSACLLMLMLVLLVEAIVPSTACANPVELIVLREHGVGSPTLAQPYLDRFVALAADLNDWPDAKGVYLTNRQAAEAFIQEHKPHYAILPLATFLALRDKYHLQVIGEVAVSLAGGGQYYLISKRTTDLTGCKGKGLVTDHTDDRRFIDTVVSGGKFTLADFKVMPTQRPLQTIKKLIAGDGECALVDDAQLAELPHIDGADGIQPVWSSMPLPSMVVAAFPAAPRDERAHFQDTFGRVCDDQGKDACGEVGIVSLHAASDADYGALLAAYAK